jgi:hypothetical protein
MIGLNWLMRWLGAIPTQKYVSDLSLIRDIMYTLHEKKSSVLMYPEAGYSFDGRTTTLPRGMGALLKRLKVPVVTVITKGAFHRDPLYNMLQIRDVKVSAHVKCVATPEEIKEKSVEELDALIDELEAHGYRSGKISIGHCQNIGAAIALRNLILQKHRGAKIEIHSLRGLCSFYAEKGGLLVGFEKI